MPVTSKPRLTLGHTTKAVRDLDAMLAFYTNVLGFHVTNRGATPDGAELAFISQDPVAHHQIVMITGMEVPETQFVLADHLAFRVDSIEDLKTVRANLEAAGVEDVIPVTHGNAWSLYFSDPEGNGLECFVDTPWHVAQPFLEPMDLDAEDLEAVTLGQVEGKPEFQPFDDWRAAFTATLGGG